MRLRHELVVVTSSLYGSLLDAIRQTSYSATNPDSRDGLGCRFVPDHDANFVTSFTNLRLSKYCQTVAMCRSSPHAASDAVDTVDIDTLELAARISSTSTVPEGTDATKTISRGVLSEAVGTSSLRELQGALSSFRDDRLGISRQSFHRRRRT